MNKQQAKQVEMAKRYVALGLPDAAARSISALIRCAMSRKSREALMAVAADLNVDKHPEFII